MGDLEDSACPKKAKCIKCKEYCERRHAEIDGTQGPLHYHGGQGPHEWS